MKRTLTGHSNSVWSLAVLENGYFARGSYHININNIEFQETFIALVWESKNNTKIPKKTLQSFTLKVPKRSNLSEDEKKDEKNYRPVVLYKTAS